MYGLSDESFVDRWIENQYIVASTRDRETNFQFEKPFDPSEFLHFRKNLGIDGADTLLKIRINLFEKKEVEEKEVLVDITLQEKYIAYSIDAKLHKKHRMLLEDSCERRH